MLPVPLVGLTQNLLEEVNGLYLLFIQQLISKHLLLLQVNSDQIFWQRKSDGTFAEFRVDKSAVGHCISTKAVGSDTRVDITHLYKHPEGNSTVVFDPFGVFHARCHY